MHFYGLNFTELRALPVSAFWEMVKNIDRLKAEADLRQLSLLSQIVGGSPIEYAEGLRNEMGRIVIIEAENNPQLDKAALLNLRALMSG